MTALDEINDELVHLIIALAIPPLCPAPGTKSADAITKINQRIEELERLAEGERS